MAQAGNFAIVTSDLTLHEVLVKPLKDGNARLVGRELFLTNDEGFRRVPGLAVTMLKDALPPADSP